MSETGLIDTGQDTLRVPGIADEPIWTWFRQSDYFDVDQELVPLWTWSCIEPAADKW